jgi:nucleoside-diphosphate-sugar epimerase
MKVVIVGAAGTIGQSACEALLARGHGVRLVGRSAAKLAELKGQGVERAPANVATEEGCRTAAAGMDALVYSLGLPYTKKAFAQYPGMMRTCLGAARAAGVRKALLITNVYPSGLPRTARVSEDHPRRPVSVKGEWRKQQEDVLLAAHDARGVQTLSLRLPNFYGPAAHLSITDGIFKAAVGGKTADLLGPVDLPQELCFTPDVGPVVADLLERDEAFGQAYNFAGPGTLTWKELALEIYRAAGTQPRFRVAGPTMLKVLGLFSSLMRELSEMSYLQTHPVLLDDRKLATLLPHLKKTPYAEGIRRTLAMYAAEIAPARPQRLPTPVG